MSINPTWDLFIVVFFGLVITYSFIIGKHEAVKIIISTYIAILAVEGIGNILVRLTGSNQSILSILGLPFDSTVVTATKLVIFVILIIFIAVRGGVDIDYSKDPGGIINVLLTALFGAATAGLLITSLFIFVLNLPLLDPAVQTNATVVALMSKSKLMEVMIKNQDLWFSLPALIIIAVGFLSNDSGEA